MEHSYAVIWADTYVKDRSPVGKPVHSSAPGETAAGSDEDQEQSEA